MSLSEFFFIYLNDSTKYYTAVVYNLCVTITISRSCLLLLDLQQNTTVCLDVTALCWVHVYIIQVPLYIPQPHTRNSPFESSFVLAIGIIIIIIYPWTDTALLSWWRIVPACGAKSIYIKFVRLSVCVCVHPSSIDANTCRPISL